MVKMYANCPHIPGTPEYDAWRKQIREETLERIAAKQKAKKQKRSKEVGAHG